MPIRAAGRAAGRGEMRPFRTRRDLLPPAAMAALLLLLVPFALAGSRFAAYSLPGPAGILAGFGLVQMASLSPRWGERAARVVRAAGFAAFFAVILGVPVVARLLGTGPLSFANSAIYGLAFGLTCGAGAAAERSLGRRSTERQ